MNKYKVTAKHDNGKFSLVVTAQTEQQAKDIFCAVENCPSIAITKVKAIN